MTYIENVYICITAVLLVGFVCSNKLHRSVLIFIIVGMGMCLLSAYINTFFINLYDADIVSATAEITPVVEEIMKLLPLIFYLLIFEPKTEDAMNAILVISISFATFENVCYLTQNGAAELQHLLIRGFGTGAMHIVCGVIVGYGILYVWKYRWLKMAGIFGLLCVAITYHAIYNLLISTGGALQYIAYILPIITVFLTMVVKKIIKVKLL